MCIQSLNLSWLQHCISKRFCLASVTSALVVILKTVFMRAAIKLRFTYFQISK